MDIKKLLHDSDVADEELNRKIEKLEESIKDTGWYDVDLSKAIMVHSGTSIVNESSNRLRLRRIGDVVYFDVRLKFDNSNTNNVMLSFWFESVAKEFIPIINQVFMIRSSQYNSDNDIDTHEVWIQFRTGDNMSLSFFRPENIKFNTVSGEVIIGTGCYIVN